mgnify:CR=1 FL=1
MKQIEFERWELDAENPCKLKYAGQRKAEDVFHELEARLDSIGYLPDEYLLLDNRWQNGREMPRDAGFFCKTDYGGSEGIYLHDRQNAWRKRHGYGSDVPHFLCDHESVPR